MNLFFEAMSIPLATLLPPISFALSLAGLLVRFIFPDSRKLTVLGILLTCLVVMTGAALYQAVNHERRVELVADQIVTALGSETKTFDELHEELYKSDLSTTTEALDSLVMAKKVGQRILEVRDNFGTGFRVRGYYAMGGETRN